MSRYSTRLRSHARLCLSNNLCFLLAITSITTAAPVPFPRDHAIQAKWHANELTLELNDAGTVQIIQFNALGSQIHSTIVFHGQNGINRLHIPHAKGATTWLRITTNDATLLLRRDLASFASTATKPNPIALGMRRIPRGRWLIGSPESEPNRYGDESQHSITLSAYWMDTTEISRSLFRKLMGHDPSLQECPDDCPVENVTWFEAILFSNARSKASLRDTAYQYSALIKSPEGSVTSLSNLVIRPGTDGFRLPTEAQWEVAARAGSSASWAWGDDSTSAQNFAWHQTNSSNQPHPIGTLRPNAWGFHDLHGNVSEWIWDWYDGYRLQDTLDPQGSVWSDQRVFRGGNWSSSTKWMRCALRDGAGPSYRASTLGFRCVRPASD